MCACVCQLYRSTLNPVYPSPYICLLLPTSLWIIIIPTLSFPLTNHALYISKEHSSLPSILKQGQLRQEGAQHTVKFGLNNNQLWYRNNISISVCFNVYFACEIREKIFIIYLNGGIRSIFEYNRTIWAWQYYTPNTRYHLWASL